MGAPSGGPTEAPGPAGAGPEPPRGMHHLAVLVRDLAAAEAFYAGVLALPVLRRWPAAGAVGGGQAAAGGAGTGGQSAAWRSVWLDTGDGAFLALERAAAGPPAAEDPARAERPGLHLVALRIARSQRRAWEARLAAAGVTVTHRTAFTLYFRDPEGNRVGLSHWPDGGDEPAPAG